MVKNKIKDFTRINKIIHLTAATCFILLLISIVAAVESPATSYETSIYKSTPIFVWASLIISVLCGTTIIIHQIYTGEHEKHDLWVLGFSLIYLSYAISLSLFILRGYYMWNMTGDAASHIGWINEIFVNGHFPTIVYPLIHTYTAELSLLLNIDLVLLHKIVPFYFSLLYVPFMYLFIRSILPQKGQVILATTASSLFVCGWYVDFMPFAAANFFLPIVLFVLVKSFTTPKIQWKMLFIGMSMLYIFFHPLPAFVLFIIFVTLWIYTQISSRATMRSKIDHNSYVINKKIIVLAVILFAGTIFWFSSFSIFNRLINIIFSPINEISHISELIKTINCAQGYGYNVVEQVIKKEGSVLVYAIITLISLPILYKERHANKAVKLLIPWYGLLGLIILFIIVFFFLTLPFGPLRFVFYLITISTIFVGFVLNKIIEMLREIDNKSLSKIGLGVVITLIVLVFVNGLLILYPSPYGLGISYHTTQTEVDGMNWLLHEKDINAGLSGLTTSPWRFSHFLLNPDERQPLKIPQKKDIAPHNFGYNNHSSLSQSYNRDVYLPITQRDMLLYVDVFPEMAELRWTSTDFEKLEYDRSVDKLYSNDGFDLWYINN